MRQAKNLNNDLTTSRYRSLASFSAEAGSSSLYRKLLWAAIGGHSGAGPSEGSPIFMRGGSGWGGGGVVLGSGCGFRVGYRLGCGLGLGGSVVLGGKGPFGAVRTHISLSPLIVWLCVNGVNLGSFRSLWSAITHKATILSASINKQELLMSGESAPCAPLYFA